MPWISGRQNSPATKHKRQRSRRRVFSVCAIFFAVLLSLSAAYLSGAPADKHLSVYSVAANYALPLVQREGRDYVGLLELLEPLGQVTAKADGSKWRIRYNSSIEGDFQVGKNHALVMGREADLGGQFLMENKRGLVPVGSLGSLLPRFLGGPVTLHEAAGRLFIGSIATHFTASLAGENPPRLVFHFTAPVNPIIATEPGSLRMTFSREPIVSPASPTLTFGNKTIPSAIFSEGNAAAAITVNASIPVMATFSSDGRTITIAPTTVAVQNIPPANPPNAAPPTSAPAQNQPTAAPTTAANPIPRRYFAVVDASHGGDDHGETLSTTLMEKDITVALARSLRQELESRGITTLVLRDSDANLAVDQRAVFANADRAAIYVALHAASFGHGVRVYTAMLPYGGDDRGPFRSWTTAQRAALPLSQTLAGLVTSELQRRQIPVHDLPAPLRPLNNILGPAIAVEVAPQGSDVSQLTAPDYQQLVTSAVATAIANARDQLGAAP
ncbi:MAG TPA: N-acetylmuramoyl-L-alanine amidase [Candidatus Sulfotelmatobacter sp.]|nr:N-acetylmuramoyl-L-alanine amidase [Candidatus Sulfotelmatobacter sp.]